MVMVNTEKNQDELVHVYLREAMKLRPDLSKSAK
jgi:chorismate mutase